MAFSTQRAVSDGTLQLLMLSIEFFDRSEITVYFDNIPTTAFTWATNTSILFNAPVPNGVEALVRRTTDLSTVRHVFTLGAQFKASTLDEDFKQILHIAQEAVEGANVGDIYSTLNMHGNKITNVGLASDPGDAISLGQVITESASAFAASLAAQAAANAAASSQADALASKNAAAASATAAAGSATAAAGSATAAAGSATAAANSATAATTNGAAQVSLATTQANNAAASASTATTQAGVATTQAGLAYTARIAAEAARDAAAASAAAANGVGPTYIDGLKMVYVGARALTITAGTCRLPNGGRATAAADIALTSISTAVGWNHVYAYDSGSNVMAIEISATVPAAILGTAYRKTSDSTRRYLGSFLTDASANIHRFQHCVLTGDITYQTGTPGTAPFPLIQDPNLPTASTALTAAGVAPVQTAYQLYCNCLISNGNAVFGIAEQTTALASGNWLTSILSSAGITIPAVINLSRVAGTLGQYLVRGAAAGVGLSTYCTGYRYER